MGLRVTILIACVLGLGAVPPAGAGLAAAEGSVPSGVSPGAPDRFARAAGDCPTFSWGGVEETAGYELIVYGVGEAGGELAAGAARPVLEARLPAGATGWTPSAEQCLPPGRYAWSVRGRGTEWSEALLFEVSGLPTAAELQRALAVVQANLDAGGWHSGEGFGSEAEPSDRPGRPREPALPAGAPEGAPVVAVQGEVPDPAGETYGLRGISHSSEGAGVVAENADPAGADLLLAGSPPAELTELGLSREDAGAVTFDFANPGVGSMAVSIDGIDVVTTATDQDTLGGLSCANGQVAKWNGSWSCGDDLDTDTTYTAGNQLTLVGTTFDVLEGAGSGLDADVLDGQDSSAFASGSHTHGLGSGNTAVGEAALASNTTGISNTAVGASALSSSSMSAYNTGVGDQALLSTVASSRNTAVGAAALRDNTTGFSNTAVGRNALRSNTDGGHNTAVGMRALEDSAGGYNTAVGSYALANDTEGHNNTAVGWLALFANTSGVFNTAMGRSALGTNQTASGNTAIGADALRDNQTGGSNTALGSGALLFNIAGHRNVAIGDFAGHDVTGSDNILIGEGVVGAAGQNATIHIGKPGTHTQAFIAGIFGNLVQNGTNVVVNSSGDLGVALSSARFKEDVEDVGQASRRILGLRPVSFRFKPEEDDEGERPLEYGLIAEEVAEIFPELVLRDPEGRPSTVRYRLLVPLLLNELQRQQQALEGQQTELARREEQLEAFAVRLERLVGAGKPRAP